jgi:uncharacterized protein YggE
MATITVRGTSTAHATPDEATVGLGIDVVRATAAESFADVTERTTKLVTRLGAVDSVRDARSAPPEPRPLRMEVAAVAALPVEAGELTVVATVDVEFALEQG